MANATALDAHIFDKLLNWAPSEGIPLEHWPLCMRSCQKKHLYAYSMGMFEDIGELVLANESTPDYSRSLTVVERQCAS